MTTHTDVNCHNEVQEMPNQQLEETSLVLRVCRSDYTSHNGFQWPTEVGAKVVAPDWQNNDDYGNDLHGLYGWLYGKGDYSWANYWKEDDAKWMVLEVPSSKIIMLNGKCRFPYATIRFVGNKADAAAFLIANEPKAQISSVIGASLTVNDYEVVYVGALGIATAGNYSTAIAGERGKAIVSDYGIATAGHYGIATAGYNSMATAGYCGKAIADKKGKATVGDNGNAVAGDYGTATAGHYGTATAGYGGTATTGKNGTAIAGYCGTAIAGKKGKATAGESGTAMAGDYGIAIAGDSGIAIVGYGGTATAGNHGEIRIQWWDKSASRCRVEVGYVGENDIKANTAYKLNEFNKFVEA